MTVIESGWHLLAIPAGMTDGKKAKIGLESQKSFSRIIKGFVVNTPKSFACGLMFFLFSAASIAGKQKSNGDAHAVSRQTEQSSPLPHSPATQGPDKSVLDLDIGELAAVKVVSSPFSNEFGSTDVRGEGRQLAAESPAANILSGDEASARNTTDTGDLLGKSNKNPGVYIQQRNPIISDPRIRGYHFGQYLVRADGAFWYPARLDVDSILSKIDSKMIDDVVVVNGPYSSRHGPGFAFIDVATRPTPRAAGCPEWHGQTGLTYNGNGQQWSGNQYLEWGATHWGASLYYGHRIGSDYLDGNGDHVPSSYNSRNVNFAFGFDATQDTSVEFRYLRQDQTDVELPGQFTDIDYLSADGFSLNLTSKDRPWADLVSMDGWYNRTRAAGGGNRASKQALFDSVFDQPAPNSGLLTLPRNSETDFDVVSTGFTWAATWGEPGQIQTTFGTDLRHYEQSLDEVQIRPAGSGLFRTATEDTVALIPASESTNPGLFTELVVPTGGRLKVKTGARVDGVSVSADAGAIAPRRQRRSVGRIGAGPRKRLYTVVGVLGG